MMPTNSTNSPAEQALFFWWNTKKDRGVGHAWCLSVSLAIFVFHFKFTDTPIGKNADPPPHTHAVRTAVLSPANSCQGDMAVRMRKVLQTAGLVFECVTCYFRFSLFFCVFQASEGKREASAKCETHESTSRLPRACPPSPEKHKK